MGGSPDNPVSTDGMQKSRKRKGVHGHPTCVHGEVNGSCDSNRYKFDFVPKKTSGPPRMEYIEDSLVSHLKPGSFLWADGAKLYNKFQTLYPHLVPYLAQLNHSVGQLRKFVNFDGIKISVHTNRIDGAWAHLRRFFNNHMVSQKDAFRYLKMFEFFFGSWAKSQNPLERLLHFMRLPVDLPNIVGPPLPKPWKDRSKSNSYFFLNFDER